MSLEAAEPWTSDDHQLGMSTIFQWTLSLPLPLRLDSPASLDRFRGVREGSRRLFGPGHLSLELLIASTTSESKAALGRLMHSIQVDVNKFCR